MKIKEKIKEKGFTVKEVADLLNISSPALSNAINGNPTVEMLSRIANAIGCSEADFFEPTQSDTINCPYCGGKIKTSKE
jgi:transcriptional regulator with XRE-family HTH domain